MTVRNRAGALLLAASSAATQRQAGLTGHATEIDGFRVAYDEGGADRSPAILMIHGFSADRDAFRRFAQGLRGFHVIIPDLPGHGATPFRPGAGYSAPTQAARLIALMDSLGIERFHVVGNSMGGFIAATLAHRAPDRVISLALFDAAGVATPDPSRLNRMLDAGHNPFLMDDPSQFDEFLGMTMAKAPFIPGVVKAAIAADYIKRRDQLAEIFDDFNAGPDMLDRRLAEIPAPAFVGWGRQDQILDVSGAHVWADGLPDARLTIYDDLGHMPMLEAPRRSARDLSAFLSSLPAGRLLGSNGQPLT